MRGMGVFLSGVVFLSVMLGAVVAQAAEEPAGEVVEMVVGLMREDDKDLRSLAFEQVRSEVPGETATRLFAAELSKLSPEAQVGLLSALADRGDKAARTSVLALVSASRDESVRAAAIGALGFLGEPADAPLLVDRLAKGSKAEQAAARASLVRLPGEAVPGSIVAATKAAPPPLVATLMGILVERRATGTIPDLLAAAVGPDPAVRGAAMSALGQLAGPEHVAAMVQGVLKAQEGREREAAEKAVMLVCGRIAEPQKRADPLLAAVEKLPGADRLAMLPTVGRVGGAGAVEVVEGAIGDADPAVHAAGIRALCNWPDATVAPRLIELSQSDPHADHRTALLRALIRIAPLPDDRTDRQRLDLLKKALELCTRDAERVLVLQRASAIRNVETLRFLAPYMKQPALAPQACQSIVELAHHRNLREPNKGEFDRALDEVIATSQDATVVERARRYKKGQTWVRPKAAE